MEIHLLANLGSGVQRRCSSFFHRYCHLDIFPESKNIERQRGCRININSKWISNTCKWISPPLKHPHRTDINSCFPNTLGEKNHCAKKIWKFRWPWWAQDRGEPKRHPLGTNTSSGRLQRPTEPWWNYLPVGFFFGRCTLGVVESGIWGQRFCSSSSVIYY